MRRRTIAHVEVPGRPGKTLCGKDPCAVTVCPACEARWRATSFVHVQSARRPDLALCGVSLAGKGVASVQLGTPNVDARLEEARSAGVAAVAFVSVAQARAIAREDLEVPLHAGCMVNLGRFLARLGCADDLGGVDPQGLLDDQRRRSVDLDADPDE